MAKKTKKQYYKVVNTKNGHHGFFYKKGLNIDPNPTPISEVGDCSPGALYFTDAKYLASWANYGDKIAWITPASKVVSNGDKWKAKKVVVTKLLPISKQTLEKIPGLSPQDWKTFDIG